MDNHEWRAETNYRLKLVARYFKPKEVAVIVDFIRTAYDISKEEKDEQAEKETKK